jgi:hypothetical protein
MSAQVVVAVSRNPAAWDMKGASLSGTLIGSIAPGLSLVRAHDEASEAARCYDRAADIAPGYAYKRMADACREAHF